MGRKINFYMDSKTEKEFQEFILKNDLLIMHENKEKNCMIYTNNMDAEKFQLYFVPKKYSSKIFTKTLSSGVIYLNIDSSYVIEYRKTDIRKKNKKIFRGRIYVIAVYFNENEEIVHKDEEFLKIYEKLVRWIKKNCPMTKFVQDGYDEKEYMSSGIKEMVEKEGYKLYW